MDGVALMTFANYNCLPKFLLIADATIEQNYFELLRFPMDTYEFCYSPSLRVELLLTTIS